MCLCKNPLFASFKEIIVKKTSCLKIYILHFTYFTFQFIHQTENGRSSEVHCIVGYTQQVTHAGILVSIQQFKICAVYIIYIILSKKMCQWEVTDVTESFIKYPDYILYADGFSKECLAFICSWLLVGLMVTLLLRLLLLSVERAVNLQWLCDQYANTVMRHLRMWSSAPHRDVRKYIYRANQAFLTQHIHLVEYLAKWRSSYFIFAFQYSQVIVTDC